MKKLLEVIPAEEISSSDFEQIENLEKMYYPDIPESEQFSSEKCIHLHSINKDALLLVKEKDKVVAFMHLLPLKVNCYKKIKSGKYPDTIIEEKDIIRYTRKELVNVYISSVIVDKSHPTLGFKYLLDSLSEKLLYLAKEKGIYFKNILGDAVTKAGVKLCSNVGFKEITDTQHNSKIYELNLDNAKNYKRIFESLFGEATELAKLYKKRLKIKQ